MQDMQQGQHMFFVAAELGLPKIVDDHVPNFFAAVLVGQKVLSECCCSDLGQVFVLGDGEHLLFGQAAEPDAILKRDHVRPQSRTGGIIRGNLHEVIRFLPLNPP